MVRRNMTARVWTLGNTTVRNPERILGAIRVFNKYYNNKKSFSSNQTQQGEFFDKLLTHTDSGEPFDPKKPAILPIYTFVNEDEDVQMEEEDYKQKNGRLWLSPMDSFGFVCAYNDKKAFTCPPGLVYITYPNLEGDIWLRQLLKFQYPNPNSEISGGAKLRPAVILFKLMLEMDGLSKFELGLTHLTRDEDISYLKELIKDYRLQRKNGNIEKLKEEIQEKAIKKHFSDEINERISKLRDLINRAKIGFVVEEKDIISELDSIVSLGKGSNTERAKQCKREIMLLIKKKEYNPEKYIHVFIEYYLLVKGDTIGKDYPDLTKRYTSMCGILQSKREEDGEIRLKVDDSYREIIEKSLNSLGPVFPVNNEKEEIKYLEYLWDTNKPKLLIDEEKYIKKEMSRIVKELDMLNWKYKLNFKELDEKIIEKKKVSYCLLRNELYKASEVKYANSLDYKMILSSLNSLCDESLNNEVFTPTEIESLFWDSLLFINGFKCHPSETRNFHVDTNFKSLFTAAGNQPDMQFPYEKTKLVIEVTKNRGKTQWRAEAEPVTRHVAAETFGSQKGVIGVFIAPEIHYETAQEFFKRSKGLPYIINKDIEVKINILPLTFKQYKKIFENIIKSKERHLEWLNIIELLSKLYSKSSNDTEWIENINKNINELFKDEN